MEKMRTFDTGATRDAADTKPDYEGFLSPLVIESFGAYMHKHRKQPDGNLRDSDNWQKGFGPEHQSVCVKSAWRHFFDVWKIHRGHKVYDSKDGHEVTLEEACCATLFNLFAILHVYLNKGNEKM